ncbi:MAG: hypothetical protein KC912_13895 [Proteobacteria bacterium]|nr:hypothetical protein [Pseudomonadota bacterium]
MATVVRHVETGERFVVLGAGFAMKDEGSVKRNRRAGVCVCDDQGRIGWFKSEDLVVESVFGQRPDEILA